MNIAAIVLLAAIVLVALVTCIVAVRRRRWVTAVLVAMLALFVIAITGFLIIKPANLAAMRGGVTLEAAPGVRFYVRERLVGTGKVFLTWDDLLATDGTEPLGIKLRPEDSFDVFKQERPPALTAEALGGPGAVCILRSHEFKSGYGNDNRVYGEQILLRRADGMLDWLLVIIAECRTPDGQWLLYLVPIRPRQDLSYLITKPEDGYGGARGHYTQPPIVRPTLHLSWSFVTASPPKELAEEIKEKGLWEPARR